MGKREMLTIYSSEPRCSKVRVDFILFKDVIDLKGLTAKLLSLGFSYWCSTLVLTSFAYRNVNIAVSLPWLMARLYDI